jgi:outer membrane immunogenic protein
LNPVRQKKSKRRVMKNRSLAVLSATTAALIWSGAVHAADMPFKALPPPPPPPLTWSGAYLGVHVGSGWGTVEAALNSVTGAPAFPVGIPISSHSINGFLGGVQIGYNFQAGPIVYGVEGSFSGADLKGTTPCVLILSCSTKVDWLGTAAGRLGFTVDRAMVYAKGGVGFADSKYNAAINTPGLGIAVSTSKSDTRLGALFGAGVEYMFMPNWTAMVEYNYIDFGKRNLNFPFAGGFVASANVAVTQNINLVKAGLNYHF